ncbi:MFS transporter [Microbacterium sp. MYb64]|uniref:MFS transporter n=1 Tax=Microbacterium sp. MYb64 TaxID=1848691 RepID=UPI000CFDC30D|nr:MFS transporter [Microbacterium sp. MYb64]PRB03439.1 MFS transporter [Microbacterium sp. MYb64]
MSAAAPPAVTDDQAIARPGARLFAGLPLANFATSLVWGSVPTVLLALQVQESLGEADKVANLAIITTIGGIFSVLSQPIAGALSDHTRSRFGRRAPWIALGGLLGGLALIGMSFASTLASFTVGWVAIIIGFNFVQGPLTAIIPDRVPRTLRGTFAALLGLGLMVGSMGGQIFASAMSKHISLAYYLLAGFAVIVLTLFLTLAPDRSSTGLVREPFRLRSFLGTFWVDPRKHPDFAWAFTSRLLLYTGYNVVFGYKLYLLQDYVGLGEAATGVLPIMGIAAVLGLLSTTVVAGRLSDRLGRRRIFVLVSATVVAIAVLVPLFLPNTTGILIMAALGGMGFGCFQAVDTALITEVLPAEADYGKDIGVVNMASTLPQVLAPSIAGLIVITSGGFALLFPIAAISALLAGIVILRVRSVR